MKRKTKITYSVFTLFIIFNVSCSCAKSSEKTSEYDKSLSNRVSQDVYEYVCDDKNTEKTISERNEYAGNICILPGSYCSMYDLVSISIGFPQIDGHDDVSIENKINEFIYNSVIAGDETNWNEYRYEVDISYEVTYLSEKYLSVVFSGDTMGSIARKDALTVNLQTGERVLLSDFYNSIEVLNIINELGFTENCTVAGILWDDSPDSRQLAIDLCNEQFMDIADYAEERRFYLREDRLGLIVWVSNPEYIAIEFMIQDIPWS